MVYKNLILILLEAFDNSSSKSSIETSIFRSIFSIANSFKRESSFVFCRLVLRRQRVEKIFLGVVINTGKVTRIRSSCRIIENIIYIIFFV